jgi:hypothetical protein
LSPVIPQFWQAISGKLAERWLPTAVTAAVFWLTGVCAWAAVNGGFHELLTWVDELVPAGQVALLIGSLIVVGGSVLVVNRLTEPAFRLVEGYWPLWLLWLWERVGRRRRAWKAGKLNAAWQELHNRLSASGPPLTAVEYARYLRLDVRRLAEPPGEHRRMPTRVGAVLRAAESRPRDRYGLEFSTVWPRLWLVLPDTTRAQVGAARKAMLDSTAVAVWGLLFTGFGLVNVWAVPAGLATAAVTLTLWLPARTQVFADLVESVFDLHRSDLYRQLRWPLPATPAEEHASGELLSQFLRRGSDSDHPKFTTPHV